MIIDFAKAALGGWLLVPYLICCMLIGYLVDDYTRWRRGA